MPSDKRAGRIQLVLVIAFVAGAFLVSHLLQLGREPPARQTGGAQVLNVTATQASPGPYRVAFTTTGIVEARTAIEIVPEVSGRVEAIASGFYPGGSFAAEEILFGLDPRDFEVQVATARAELARAQSNLSQVRAEAAVARAERRDVPGEATPLALREPQLQAAEAALAGARAQLAGAELALTRSRYRLPFAGRVIDSGVALGQYLRAGQSYGEVFDPASLEVRASLADTELRWLLSAAAPEITIEVDFLGQQRRYPGRLLRGPSSLDLTTRFASVHFGFVSADTELLPGVFARVAVRGPVLENITLLPASSRQRDGGIWRIQADQTLAPLGGELVYSTDTTLAVAGLEGPVQVVSSRLPGASAGMQVAVVAETTDIGEQPSSEAAQSTPDVSTPDASAPGASARGASARGASAQGAATSPPAAVEQDSPGDSAQ